MKITLSIIVVVAIIILIALFVIIYNDYSSPENLQKDVVEEDFIDCGESSKSLDDFGNSFFDVNFNEDPAFSCMGENIKGDCVDSGLIINDNGTDFVYKISGPDCSAGIEIKNPEDEVMWIECPISSLVSFAQEQAETVSDFQKIIDKMDQGDGDYGATVFALTALSLTFDKETFEQFGCSSNNY